MDEHTGDLPPGYHFRPDHEITPAEAAKRLDAGGFLIVDVREPDEVRAHAIPGTEHVPLGQLIERWDDLEVDEDQPFGVMCAHGVRSLQAVLFLHQMGLTGARSVAGGISCWPSE
ncbi:MAG: rhodanese-like domain-containing protein [Phycisphaerales bacterium JB040]